MAFLSDLTAIIGQSGFDKQRLLDHNINLERTVQQRTKEIIAEKNFSDSLINNLPGIMYVFDQLGAFKRWNKNVEIVTGYSADQIKTLTPLDFFSTTEDKERFLKTLKEFSRAKM